MNDELAEIDPLGRLLFAGLWTIADREGRLFDRPKKIKAEVLPYDNCDMDKLLQNLNDYGFILRYEIDGTKYIQITNWVKHQNPHVKESASTIPAPYKNNTNTVKVQTLTANNNREKNQEFQEPSKINSSNKHHASTVQEPEEHSTSPADSLNLIPDSLNRKPDSSINIVTSTTREEDKPVDKVELDVDGFEDFWNEYPKKTGKLLAADAWQVEITKGVSISELKYAAQKYALKIKREGTELRYVKAANNFLSERVYSQYLPKYLPDCPKCRGQGFYNQEQPDGRITVIECECARRAENASGTGQFGSEVFPDDIPF